MKRLSIPWRRSDSRRPIHETCAVFVRELEDCYARPLATPELDEVLARCVPGGYPDGGRRPAASPIARSMVLAQKSVADETLEPAET